MQPSYYRTESKTMLKMSQSIGLYREYRSNCQRNNERFLFNLMLHSYNICFYLLFILSMIQKKVMLLSMTELKQYMQIYENMVCVGEHLFTMAWLLMLNQAHFVDWCVANDTRNSQPFKIYWLGVSACTCTKPGLPRLITCGIFFGTILRMKK